MLWEILKASKGILVADFYADLWANIAGGGTPVDVFVEMIGTLPLYYDGKGIDLADYIISGNAVQDGTPSADAPAEVQGSGVRTGNLWNEDYTGIAANIKYVSIYVGEGSFTLSTSCPDVVGNAALFFLSGNVQSGASTTSNGVYLNRPITATSSAGYVTVAYRHIQYSTGTADPREEKTMLNLGSTALPYEPYGYKLPLTVNGTEYPIYLGTVPTTRKIKKLVLTGEEEIAIRTGNAKWFIPIADLRVPTMTSILWYCSHYQAVANNAPWASYDYMISWSTTDTGSSKGLRIRDVNFLTGATVADFKSYLAAQYQNGTPVTVWYVLAEPETAVVNEPLMKIGDYTDTVSFAQAGVTIPTVNGANVLDMASTVKPSEVYIKGKGIKPTGYGQLADVNGVNILDKDGRPKGGN